MRVRTGDERHVMLDTSTHDADVDENDLRRAEAGQQWLCEMDALDPARAWGIH
jgi:hypothetical protein